AEDGIRDFHVTGVQTCALPISMFRPTSCLYSHARGVAFGTAAVGLELSLPVRLQALLDINTTVRRASIRAAFRLLICFPPTDLRSEEHTSELQSRENLVCRLLL